MSYFSGRIVSYLLGGMFVVVFYWDRDVLNATHFFAIPLPTLT